VIDEECELARQPVWISNIVGIHSRQVEAARAVDTFIQAGREPAPLPVSPGDNARVVEAARDGQPVIFRTIVAEQEFKVAVALMQERADGQLQGGGAVEEGHGDGDDGVSHRL
jgi:hypothetical protein